jgi:tetraacyldisaccharide 4'-kinase
MNRIERELHRMWRGEQGAGLRLLEAATAPLSVLFGAGVRARNLLFDAGALPIHRGPLPIVSVGNLAVGGTGKTPVSAWVARALRSAGRTPAIVLRGYGDDEMQLHRRWNPDVPVFRAIRRIDGVREAAAWSSDVVVLDDGFQHRRIRRDLDLLLLSPAHPFPPRLLPRGPFRESLRAVRRADRVLVTAKGTREIAAARALTQELRRLPAIPPVEMFTFRTGPWEALDGVREPPPPGEPFLVTSVAEPRGFAELVAEQLGGEARRLSFRDHHTYTKEDANRISQVVGGGWVATTEKDAVKLLSLRDLLPEVRVLPLVPVPPDGLAEAVVRRVDLAARASVSS